MSILKSDRGEKVQRHVSVLDIFERPQEEGKEHIKAEILDFVASSSSRRHQLIGGDLEDLLRHAHQRRQRLILKSERGKRSRDIESPSIIFEKTTRRREEAHDNRVIGFCRFVQRPETSVFVDGVFGRPAATRPSATVVVDFEVGARERDPETLVFPNEVFENPQEKGRSTWSFLKTFLVLPHILEWLIFLTLQRELRK